MREQIRARERPDSHSETRMDRISVRIGRIAARRHWVPRALVGAALVGTLAPSSAQAITEKQVIDTSSITSPADPAFIRLEAGQTLFVEGKVHREPNRLKKEGVDLICYWSKPGAPAGPESEEVELTEKVGVTYGAEEPTGTTGEFGVEVKLPTEL